MDAVLKKLLKDAILDHGAIRFVRVSSKIEFFLIKVPGTILEEHQSLKFKPDEGFINYDLLTNSPPEISRNSCVIFDGKKLYFRGKNKVVEEYILKYHPLIFDSPEFVLSSVFKPFEARVRLRSFEGWEKSDLNVTVPDFGYLMFRKDLKIRSPKYFKEVIDLLRQVGLLKESRGKIKPADSDTIKLRAFILKEFKSLKRQKPLPLRILKDKLQDEVYRRFKDEKKADKYNWSEATIRRIIKSGTKK